MPAKNSIKKTEQFHIGTSGFSYAYWKNRFYPEKLAASKWFEYYCTRFSTLELNNTFYRFPEVKNLKKFYERAPEHFLFSIKAHKIITHTLRMKNAGEKVNEFVSVVQESMQEKLGCILFQLPPSFAYTEENMEHILSSVPHYPSNVIEFRNSSWWNPTVIKTLHENKITFCNVSYPGLPETFHKTTDLFYLRMHGVPELFKSAYSDVQLKKIKENIPAKMKDVYVFFNNTMFEAGYSNALTLQGLVEKK